MIKLLDKDVQEITKDINKLKEEGIEFALVYQYDSLTYCEIEDLQINWQTFMEARLFGEKKELHIIKEQNSFKVLELQEDAESRYLKTTYLLEKSSGFKRMQIKKYIKYDEDGQAYISYVRPCKLYRG